MKTFQTSLGAFSVSARPASPDGPVRRGWTPVTAPTVAPASRAAPAPAPPATPARGVRRRRPALVWSVPSTPSAVCWPASPHVSAAPATPETRARAVSDRASAPPSPARTEGPAPRTAHPSTAPVLWDTRATSARTISPSATLSPASITEPA